MKKSLVRGAGASRELIEGPIWKGLIAFAFPIFLGNLFQQLYNTADTLIVGNFIDKQALAAVSSSGNLIFMIVGLLNGIAMGAGVIIAKFFGAKDEDGMRRAIHTDIAFGLVGGLVLTAIGVAFTPHILRWMGTPDDVLPSSIIYFRTYFYGVLASFMYNIATGILHAVGDSKHPLYYLIAASVTNVLLDLLFIAVFKWGIASAAAATVISQFISAFFALRRLMTVNESYRVNLREIRFDMPILKSIIRFGLPSGVQNSVIGFANVMVQKNINIFESDAMAGCGSYAKIEGFAFLPVTCFAMALST
ncbi:MAG: MATE family efflux transporter, partial [Clostridia bacterium]|nr:MATE family efflux transporter [Clostridia bacterium]